MARRLAHTGTVVLAHRDRLVGFADPASTAGARIAILVPHNESLSPEQEMVQDLRSIMHGFSSRFEGLGGYRKKLNEAIGRT